MLRQTWCVLLLATFAIASKNAADVMNSLLDAANYKKGVRPDPEGTPTDVRVEISLLDAYNLDELKHQVTLSMYLRQKWKDSRLSFSSAETGVNVYMLDAEQVKRLWIPDTFIANERSVVKHGFSTPNEYTKVENNGNITRSFKLTVTVACILNLRWFPFDQNVCSLDFESYGYSTNEVKYSWGRDYHNGKSSIWISKGASQSVRHEITAFRGSYAEEGVGEVKYFRTAFEIYFKRRSFRYLLDVYFPATAIPVVAFITLCVGPLHFCVLLSTICMAMMVVYAAILMLLTPKVDYKTALDFYVFNSSVTVFNVVLDILLLSIPWFIPSNVIYFGMILVNFLIYYLLKPKPSATQIRMRQLNGSGEEGKGILADEDSAAEDPTAAGTSNAQPRFPNKASELLYKLSSTSYYTMPIFFVVFNIIYWTVVLIASSGTPEDFVPIEDRNT